MDAEIWELDTGGKPGSSALEGELRENIFYFFDAEAVNAINHAIEELALEEATGQFLALYQRFSDFEPHRERYWQLGATLDRVEVRAAGRKPRRHGRVRFIGLQQSVLRRFCLVLYQGSRVQALLVGRAEKGPGAPRFSGFYSLNRRLIERVRKDLEALLAGQATAFAEFDRQHALDRAAKQIEAEFSRQKQAVGLALRRLQVDGDRHQTRRFLTEMDRSLGRLAELKSQLPDWMRPVSPGR